MVIWYVVWFLAGAAFMLAILGGCFLYVYLHREQLGSAFIKHAMANAMERNKMGQKLP
jgi:hypothetical protein